MPIKQKPVNARMSFKAEASLKRDVGAEQDPSVDPLPCFFKEIGFWLHILSIVSPVEHKNNVAPVCF